MQKREFVGKWQTRVHMVHISLHRHSKEPSPIFLIFLKTFWDFGIKRKLIFFLQIFTIFYKFSYIFFLLWILYSCSVCQFGDIWNNLTIYGNHNETFHQEKSLKMDTISCQNGHWPLKWVTVLHLQQKSKPNLRTLLKLVIINIFINITLFRLH